MKKPASAILTAMLCMAAAAARVASFAPESGVPFTVPEGGKLISVQAFAPADGTVALSSIYSADVFTNAIEVACTTQTVYTVVFSNVVTGATVTNSNPIGYVKTPAKFLPLSSNEVSSVSAFTNSWPVYKGTLAVTNSIAGGEASAHIFAESVATNNVYIAPGETLLFTGTAVGGWLRLVLE